MHEINPLTQTVSGNRLLVQSPAPPCNYRVLQRNSPSGSLFKVHWSMQLEGRLPKKNNCHARYSRCGNDNAAEEEKTRWAFNKHAQRISLSHTHIVCHFSGKALNLVISIR